MDNYFGDILESLEDNRCVVLLGPRVALTAEQVPIDEALIQYLQQEHSYTVSRDLDGLYQMEGVELPRRFSKLLRRFIKEQAVPNSIHQHLTRIPVPLYLSITPDELLKQAFDGAGVRADTDFFNRSLPRPEPNGDVIPMSPQRPLIYQLFGSASERASLIVNHEDMVHFFMAILGKENHLPERIQAFLQRADCFIFLGFEFERWYLKFLLHLLNVDKKSQGFAGGQNGTSDAIREYFRQKYGMYFIAEEIGPWLEKLCESCQEEGLLREVSEEGNRVEESFQAEIKELLALNQLEQALIKMRTYCEGKTTHLEGKVVSLMGQYHQNKGIEIVGTESHEVVQRQYNKIRQSMLQLLETS